MRVKQLVEEEEEGGGGGGGGNPTPLLSNLWLEVRVLCVCWHGRWRLRKSCTLTLLCVCIWLVECGSAVCVL